MWIANSFKVVDNCSAPDRLTKPPSSRPSAEKAAELLTKAKVDQEEATALKEKYYNTTDEYRKAVLRHAKQKNIPSVSLIR
jgi:hypothetical protein